MNSKLKFFISATAFLLTNNVTAQPLIRYIHGSWVNVRDSGSATAKVVTQWPANTQVAQIAQKDGWCEVAASGDKNLVAITGDKGFVRCDLLGDKSLTLEDAANDPMRAFWVAPSSERLKAYGNALPRPQELTLPYLSKFVADKVLQFPKRSEFEAAKAVMRKGIVLGVSNEIKRGQPVDPVATHSKTIALKLKPISPSLFKEHGDIALLSEAGADGLAAVTGSQLSVAPTELSKGKATRHGGPYIEFITGFWDVGAAYFAFKPALNVFSISPQGLIGGKTISQSTWYIDNESFCGMQKNQVPWYNVRWRESKEQTIAGYANLKDDTPRLMEFVTKQQQAPKTLKVFSQRYPKTITIYDKSRVNTASNSYELDFDGDGIADALVVEIVTGHGQASLGVMLNRHYYLNINGQWFSAGYFQDIDCT